MGFLRWFYIEAKSFKFAVEEGVSVLWIFERSRGVLRSVFLGKVSVAWLLDMVEALTQAEGLKECLKSSRVGSRAFLAQCSNRQGCFLALAEYGGGGGRRGCIVILEGKEGTKWSGFCPLLHKVLEFFNLFTGTGRRVLATRKRLGDSPSTETGGNPKAAALRASLEALIVAVGKGTCAEPW